MTNFNFESSLRKRLRVNSDPEPITEDYGSSQAYCEKVRKWVFDTQCWNGFHQNNMMMMQQAQQMRPPAFQNGSVNIIHAGNVQINGMSLQMVNGQRFITSQYRPASFLKRCLAELIDFCCMLGVKMMLILLLIDLDLIDLDKYEKLLGEEADLSSFIDLTQSLFPYELMGKIIASILEAFCISYGIGGRLPGASPGKLIMRIRVISATSVSENANQPGLITVTGTETVPIKSALTRSLIKNLFVESLLPLSALAFVFTGNRSVYDVCAKTVVVERQF